MMENKSGGCYEGSSKELLNLLKGNNFAKFNSILRFENLNINQPFGEPHFGTLLDISCRNKGNARFVEALLNHGADPNIINVVRKKGPLHFATISGDDEMVKLLLENETINVNLADDKGNTALHYALTENLEEIITLLLNHNKIEINAMNRKGITPLYIAVENENLSLIKKLINQPNINLEIEDMFSGSTLRQLICEKFPQLEEDLSSEATKPSLSKCMNVDQMFNLLATNRFDSFIEAMEKNRDILESNNGFHTFLQYCCEYGILDVVKELLRYDVNPNSTHNNNSKTPLMIAASKGFVPIVILLVNNNKTCFNPVNNETVLHCTIKGSCDGTGLGELDIERNHLECLKILLKVPRDKLSINQQDIRGNTALHYAAKLAEQEMVQLLLGAGAYIGIHNNNGEPACSDITFKTFEVFLDNCIYTNNKLRREDDYQIIFNYKCLIPYEQFNPKGSVDSGQNMIVVDVDQTINNCESEPLLYMTRNQELRPLLKHPIFTSFLHLKWHKMRTYFFINLLLYLLFCGFLTAYILNTYSKLNIATNVTNATSTEHCTNCNYGFLWAMVTLFLTFLIIREIFQLSISPLKYVLNPENWLEIGIIAISISILFCQYCLTFKHQISAIGILFSWVELVLLVGRHPALSTNIEMLKTVSWTFMKFLAWYSILIIAFALSFHSLFKDAQDDENLFEDPGISMFKTVIMLTGEFDTGSIPFIQYPGASHLLFVLFVFLIPIVLFNLLNGLAVSDTQAIKSDAELVGYISRVKLVCYIENILANPSICFQMSSKAKDICCCLSQMFCDTKNKIFAKKINLFQNMSHNFEIGIFPNLENRVEINTQKNLGDFDSANKNQNCLDNCNVIYMDREIVKTAKEILIKKQEEQEQFKNNKKLAEKEKMMTQTVEDCRKILKNTEQMLTEIHSLLISREIVRQ